MCRLRGAAKQPSPTWGRLPGSKVFTRPSPWDLLIPDLCTFVPDIPSVCVQNVISVHPRQSPFTGFQPQLRTRDLLYACHQWLTCPAPSLWPWLNEKPLADQLLSIASCLPPLCLADCLLYYCSQGPFTGKLLLSLQNLLQVLTWGVRHFWQVSFHIPASVLFPGKSHCSHFTHPSPVCNCQLLGGGAKSSAGVWAPVAFRNSWLNSRHMDDRAFSVTAGR